MHMPPQKLDSNGRTQTIWDSPTPQLTSTKQEDLETDRRLGLTALLQLRVHYSLHAKTTTALLLEDVFTLPPTSLISRLLAIGGWYSLVRIPKLPSPTLSRHPTFIWKLQGAHSRRHAQDS